MVSRRSNQTLSTFGISDRDATILAAVYENQLEGINHPLEVSYLSKVTGISELKVGQSLRALTHSGLLFPDGIRRAGKAFVENNNLWSTTTAIRLNQFCDAFLTQLVAYTREQNHQVAIEVETILAKVPSGELGVFEFCRDRMVEKGLLTVYERNHVSVGPRLRSIMFEQKDKAA